MLKRSSIAGVVALAAAACADPPAASYGPIEAAVERTPICHFDAVTGDYGWLMIPNGRALEKHLAHGDGIPGGPVPGMNGYVFDENCVPVAVERVFAIAYADVDPNDGPGFKDGIDVLIAKLVDANNDGVASVGDQVVLGMYPLDFGGTAYGNFSVATHAVTDVLTALSGFVQVESGTDHRFVFFRSTDRETYWEQTSLTSQAPVEIGDAHNDGGFDYIYVRTTVMTAPSVPSTEVFVIDQPIPNADHDYLEVELNP